MLRYALIPLAFLSAPAWATGYYQAEPQVRPAQERFAVRDSVWRCGERGCTAGRGQTRPALVCAGLVRQVGTLRSFSVEGRAFAADELENCNRRAR